MKHILGKGAHPALATRAPHSSKAETVRTEWSSIMFALLLCATPATVMPPCPWVVACDWDDTIKAGGNGRLFGIRGVGKRVRGTYPGMTTLLANLDECGSVDVQIDEQSFQIWSANPFSSKKQSSCVPHLHRRPMTRRGSLLAGLAWALDQENTKSPGQSRTRALAPERER